MAAIAKSEDEPPLAALVDRWLERTPGLEVDGFNFWGKFQQSVHGLLAEEEEQAKQETNEKLQSR